MILEILSYIIIVLATWMVWENMDTRLPPGPIKIPILGTLIQLGLAGKEGYLAIDNLSKKYGDVMSLKMGFLDVECTEIAVVLSSYEGIKEVFNKEKTLGRLCQGMYSDRWIIFSNVKSWSETRQFCKETLRDYGFGNRHAMEQVVHEEIGHLVKTKESEVTNGKIHFTHDYFHFTFANVIANITTGSRHANDDVQIRNLLKASSEYAESGVIASGTMMAYPFLRLVFPKILGYNIQQHALAGIMNYAAEFLKKRRNDDYRTNPRCFVDDFLNKMDESDATSNPDSIFIENRFLVLFADLFQTGAETSANSVAHMLRLIASNPIVQIRMQAEIYKICGRERLPSIEDRSRMPYTKAVVLEGVRWARTAVNGLPKKVKTDFKYKNHLIKKGTIWMLNAQAVFFDEAFWGDPHTFRPDRFLDESGEFIQTKAERISIAFGSGKRNCFGEVLARDSSFLVLAALVQKFEFQLPKDQELPNLEPAMGLTLFPYPYDALVLPRF